MNIFVGCSSRDTDDEIYNKMAQKIADFIVENGHNYVFGGCDTGLMGKIYKIVSKSPNSKIIVAMAKAYERNLESIECSKVYLADTVNERKNDIEKLSDVMLFIPGGIGTIDELLTAIESKRAHEHSLPIIIINEKGFFDPILSMLDRMYDEGFADTKNRKLYLIVDTAEEALEYLLNSDK